MQYVNGCNGNKEGRAYRRNRGRGGSCLSRGSREIQCEPVYIKRSWIALLLSASAENLFIETARKQLGQPGFFFYYPAEELTGVVTFTID